MMCPQPSQPSNHWHICLGICGLWPAWGSSWDNRISLSFSLASVVHSQRHCRCLFDISSIETRLDFADERRAALWAVGWLRRWYIARCCGYFRPCVHHIFECYKITKIDLHCRGLNVFCWHVCGANPNARQLRNIDPPSGRLRRYWHRLNLFGHALWRVVDVKNSCTAV